MTDEIKKEVPTEVKPVVKDDTQIEQKPVEAKVEEKVDIDALSADIQKQEAAKFDAFKTEMTSDFDTKIKTMTETVQQEYTEKLNSNIAELKTQMEELSSSRKGIVNQGNIENNPYKQLNDKVQEKSQAPQQSDKLDPLSINSFDSATDIQAAELFKDSLRK